MRRLFVKIFSLIKIILFLFSFSISFAQTGWFEIPGVSGETLNEIKTSFGVPWIVGNNGTIFKTTDAGNTWVIANSGVTVDLNGFISTTSNQFWVDG